ncbi:hypothetical protein VCHENC02_1238B, partial [Vibrio harveyi]
QN